MADEKNANRDDHSKAMGAAAGAPHTTESQEMKAQRGGEQEDQIAGETPRGAHNQEQQNSNPSGNKPNRNQSARQEGNDL